MASWAGVSSHFAGSSRETMIRGAIGAAVVLVGIVVGITMWRYAGMLPEAFKFVFKEPRHAPGSEAEERVMSLAFQLVPMVVLGLWALFGALPARADDERLGITERRALRRGSCLPGAVVGAAMPAAVVMSGLPVRLQLTPLAIAAVGAVIIGKSLSTGTSHSRAAFRGAGLAVVGMVLATPFVTLGAVVLSLGSPFWMLLFPILLGVVGGLLPTQGLRFYVAGSRFMARHPRVALAGEWSVALLGPRSP